MNWKYFVQIEDAIGEALSTTLQATCLLVKWETEICLNGFKNT
jgi:hypothetical protein